MGPFGGTYAVLPFGRTQGGGCANCSEPPDSIQLKEMSLKSPNSAGLWPWGGMVEVFRLLPARNVSWGAEFGCGEQKLQQLMKDLLCSLPSSLCQLGSEGPVSTERSCEGNFTDSHSKPSLSSQLLPKRRNGSSHLPKVLFPTSWAAGLAREFSNSEPKRAASQSGLGRDHEKGG